MVQQKIKSHLSLERALSLLLVFESQISELGTVDLSNRLNIHKSTVSRLLKVLKKYEFIRQNPVNNKYYLGPSIIRLSRSINRVFETNIVQIAKPFIDDTCESLKESVILEVNSGNNMIVVYIAEGLQTVRLAGNVGDRLPLHAAAGGKAFLAFCDDQLQESLIDQNLRRYTKNTITDREDFLLRLQEIKEQGFAYDKEELGEGTWAIGAPILNHDYKPIASVVIAGPSQRMADIHKKSIIPVLLGTARKISEQFYFKKII